MTVAESITRSAETFRDRFWPLIGPDLGGGELVPVETVTHSHFAKLLDTLGMTDAWQVKNGHGMRALATRVQWCNRSWATWTIRFQLPSGNRTEYHKLMEPGDWQRPHYVIQSYVTADGLECAAIRGSDLRLMLENGWYEGPRPAPGGNLFLYVPWALPTQHGIEIIHRAA